MLTCILIDDEPSAIDVLSIHAAKIPALNVLASFTNPFEAHAYLKNNPIDLIFLDINMPGLSGLQMLDTLSFSPRVVFTTAYSEYAVDSYDYQAIDYLLKPIEFDKFHRAVNRAEETLNQKRNENGVKRDFVFIKDGLKQIKVIIAEIRYVQSDGNYLNIYTSSGRVNTRMTLRQICELLPQEQFRRVHNSYVVNIEQIERIENCRIFIPDGEVSVGPAYREEFFRFLEA